MKRQRKPTLILAALCLAAVIGGGWFVINRIGAPATTHGKEGTHAVKQDTGVAPKAHGGTEAVLKRDADPPGGQTRETPGDGELAPLPTNEPLPYRIRHAVTYGAKAKITLRVVDSKGVPVADALVGGGFYNHDEKGHDFKERANEKGEVTLEDTCVGDLNFGVMKDGYYSTGTTYWFFKNYFDCVKDGRSAVRYIRSHAADFGIDPRKIAVCGGSAGGHVAAGTALFEGIDDPADDRTIQPGGDALVLYFPVIDTSSEGYGNAKCGEAWQEISPLHRVRAGLPPTIVFHGTGDTVTPFKGASAFRDAMVAAGNRCELVVNDGGKHGYLMNDAVIYEQTMRQTREFLLSLGFESRP